MKTKTELRGLKKEDLVALVIEMQEQDSNKKLVELEEQLKEEQDSIKDLADDLDEAMAETQDLQEKLDDIMELLNLWKLRHTVRDVLEDWSPANVLELRRALDDIEKAYLTEQDVNHSN